MQQPNALPEATGEKISTAIAYSLLMCFVLFYSHLIFNDAVHEIKQLARDDWQRVDIIMTPDIQFDFLKFRTGETRLYIEENYQEFYSQTCNGRLAIMCQNLQQNNIQVTSLNFYTLIHPSTTAYTFLKLNSIRFIDAQGREQVYPNRLYAPNAPEMILQQKKSMAWFFLPTAIGYFLFGLLGSSHNIGHLSNNPTVQHYATRLVIVCFALNYLYLVGAYIFICIRI